MKKDEKSKKEFKQFVEKMCGEDKCCSDGKCCGRCGNSRCGTGGALYGMGFLGAAYYYIAAAPTFWAAVIGFLKALVWPAFLVFEIMKYLRM